MRWFNVGDRVKSRYGGNGTIISFRKIDIDVHPITGDPTDGYCYRVELDNWTTDDPIERLIGKSPQFYANEIERIEEAGTE